MIRAMRRRIRGRLNMADREAMIAELVDADTFCVASTCPTALQEPVPGQPPAGT